MKKVLFTRLNALGDIVLTSGVLATIAEKHPKLEIHYLTYKKNAPIIDYFPSPPHQIYKVCREKAVFDLKALEILKHKYDLIVDWQGTTKSARLLKHLQSPKKVTINKNSLARRAYVHFRLGKKWLNDSVVLKYAKTCFQELSIDPNSIPLETLNPQLDVPSSNLRKEKTILIHPYASQKNKVWPHTEKLIHLLSEQNIPTKIIGSSEDPLIFSRPLPSISQDLTNQTSLKELLSEIASARAVITTDSGPLHLSVGLKRPTIALFGPTTKEMGFYPSFEKSRVMENKELQCRPCHVHGGHICPYKHHDCMISLTPEKVFAALQSLI